MTQTLYRKWRPTNWQEIVGQAQVVQTLRNAIAAGRFAHAYLFAGPRGTGKTTTARILAKALNCLAEDGNQKPCGECQNCLAIQAGRFLDLIEIDAASNTSVEDVRDLREKINFAPNQGKYKVYIIDEVHMLSTAAFNALLKTLEEPPAHAIFVLATTEVHKIPATVLSRCQRHEFRRIPLVEIVAQLEKIAQQENISVDPAALQLIARQATGSLRDAISLLDQLASAGKPITVEWVGQLLGTVASQSIIELTEAILNRDPQRGLQIIHQTLDSGADGRVFSRQMIEHLRNLVMVKVGHGREVEAPQELKQKFAEQAQKLTVAQLLDLIRAFQAAASETRLTWLTALPLEMALLEGLQALQAEAEKPSTVLPSSQPAGGRSTAETKAIARQKSTAKETIAQEQGEEPLAVPASAAKDEQGLTLEAVQAHWREIRALVRSQNPSVEALLNSCKPAAVKGRQLFLVFNGEFAKQKMERPEALALVNRAINKTLNCSVEIRCLLRGIQSDELPQGVDHDGVIAEALRLGGEIVDIQD
ncbi:MAG: DNA polymerase III subunits gamma and tau [Anaerolineae bacterium]|jgi:DNA polymerase-3 subunit gamma/tau|nr:MAG: DNA polymerase III subunits gamma and tau [Anaerolineae bacterium]